MNNQKIEEYLLGHLLKANEPTTECEMGRLIGCNPRTRHTLQVLQSALAPLAADQENPEPPADLWLRTIGRVAEHMVTAETRPSQVGEPPVFGKLLNEHCSGLRDLEHATKKPKVLSTLMPASDPDLPIRGRWNIVAIVGLSLAGLAFLFPAVIHLRQHQERMVCQNNMQRFYSAAASHAERHDGRLPQIEEGEKVAHIMSILEETGSVGIGERFTCQASHTPATLPFGTYAYTLGYRDSFGELRGLTIGKDSAEMPLLADAPERHRQNHQSENHRHGQNVLFLNGSVRFCSHVTVGINHDNIFVNDEGHVGAGLKREDSVLGRAEERP